MADQDVGNTSPSTVAKENQVDGVLQNYLDQLLIVATEPLEVSGVVGVTEVTDISETTAVALPVETSSLVSPESDLAENPVDVTSPTQLYNTTVVGGEIQGWDIFEASVPVVVPAITACDTALRDNTETAIKEQTPEMVVSAAMRLDWDSSQGVDCLIFKVAGLKLAIPLPLLGGVYTVDNKVTPLFGQAKWSLGVWQAEGQKLTVVDSAQLIMPERGVALQNEGYNYLIQLDRAPWALACQEICDTRDLVSGSIKWRGDTSKRPWLAGTVISEMCALIDVSGLLSLLESQS